MLRDKCNLGFIFQLWLAQTQYFVIPAAKDARLLGRMARRVRYIGVHSYVALTR